MFGDKRIQRRGLVIPYGYHPLPDRHFRSNRPTLLTLMLYCAAIL
jgi:hypothetical protein